MKRLFLSAIAGIAVVSAYHAGMSVWEPAAVPVSIDQLAACVERTGKDRRACWEQYVASLLGHYSAKGLMDALATSSGALRDECHVIGHIVGTQLYDTRLSVEESLAECSSSCRNACAHGVVAAAIVTELGESFPGGDLAHTDRETISVLGKRYCERPTLCHGVGHVVLLAHGDLMVSLETCNGITENTDAREKCYEGVFMENASGGSSFEKMTERRIDRDPGSSSCAAMPEQYLHACYRYEWFFWSRQYPDAAPLDRLEIASRSCDVLAPPAQDYCHEGIAVFAADVFEGRIHEMQAYCALYSEDQRQFCDRGIVRRLVDNHSFDDAYDFCGGVSAVQVCSEGVAALLEKKDINREEIARLCRDSEAFPLCSPSR